MRITKREILSSIVIVLIMFAIGFVISEQIDDALMNHYQEYNTALQIDNDNELLNYAMKTNLGNSFIYGKLSCVDTVSDPDIDGVYSAIIKEKEEYTRHTRTVTKTREVNGKTQTYTETEVYWTWDVVARWEEHSKTICLLQTNFDYGTIPFPNAHYITTIDGGYHIRYCYYGSPAECIGTVYGKLADNTITDAKFFEDKNINDTIEYLESNMIIVFWTIWIFLIIISVIIFYEKENNWLEDE